MLSDLLVIAGVALVAVGCYMLAPFLGPIAVGVACIAYGIATGLPDTKGR